MNSNIYTGNGDELFDFACRFLEDYGAVLEARKDHVDALLPRSLVQALGTGDLISITTGDSPKKTSGTPEMHPIHFGSSMLETMTALAGGSPPILQCEVKYNYLKKSGFNSLIKRQFNFYKSTGKVANTGEIKTHYAILTSRFLAQSDEQKEGLVDLGFNVDTGAFVPDMVGLLAGEDKKYFSDSSRIYSQEVVEKIMGFVRLYINEAVEKRIVDFRKSMNRRFIRDSLSLEEYYAALKNEMELNLSRTGLSEQLIAERKEKIALIPDELESKKKDLFNKYSINIKVSLAAVMAISTPAVKIFFSAMAGRNKKNLSMTYNPITKCMDPLVCECCGKSMYRIGFCDNQHLLCATCHDCGCSLCNSRGNS